MPQKNADQILNGAPEAPPNRAAERRQKNTRVSGTLVASFVTFCRRYAALFLSVLPLATPCMAQDVPAWEFFGGYSFQRSDVRQYFRSTPIQFTFRGEYMNFHGWNLSVTENRNRWFGGTLDVRGHTKTTEYRGTTNREQTYSFLYGPRFSYRMSWLNPFTHILMGAARTKVNVTPTGQPRASDTSFAAAAGLGLDVKFANTIAARIQADYFRTDVLGTRPDSFRTSAGVVFHLGKRE